MSVKLDRGVIQTGNTYYTALTTTTLYQECSFGFPAQRLSLVNDSDSDPVQVSWDGATLHYGLGAAEFKDIPADGRTSVYIKATTGGEVCRVNAT
jgi:hypothetical protein